MRTPAAADRLWDLALPLAADPRLEVWFALDRGSRFSGALPEQLVKAGALHLDWAEALTRRFDVALAASDKTELHQVQAPVVLMPHGAGYQRYSPGGTGEISGLRRSALVYDGQIVPDTVVVAHRNQIAALRRIDPRLPSRALVAGDPAVQRISRCLPLRHRYRDAFGTGRRRLIVLASTWGPESLFGRSPWLASEIVHGLSPDEFVVAMVLHPNVWERHGELQIRAWTRSATAAGLRLLPADGEWRAAIVAADLVISDHGSLTSYAVAVGKPVLLAADGGAEVVPESAMDQLRNLLPRLQADRPLDRQISTALSTGPVGSEYVASTFADRDAIPAMLSRIYRIMGLACPTTTEKPLALPVPALDLPAITVLNVDIVAAETTADEAVLRLHRTPAPSDTSHLVASDWTTDIDALERAAALFSGDSHPDNDQARSRAASLLRGFPGARLAMGETGEGTKVAVLRDGREVTITGSVSISAACTGLHWWSLGAGRPLAITLDAGSASGQMIIHLNHPADPEDDPSARER